MKRNLLRPRSLRRRLPVCILTTLLSLAGCQRERSITSEPIRKPSAASPSTGSDLTILDAMSAHHEQAVLMWQDAQRRASHPELREFAGQAIDEQRRELFLMHLWRDRWFPGAPSPPQPISAAGTATPVAARSEAAAFDETFLTMMVAHHQQSAAMARTAATNADSPKLRELAEIIVNQQEEQVTTMQKWQREWFSPADGGKPRR